MKLWQTSRKKDSEELKKSKYLDYKINEKVLAPYPKKGK